MWRKEYRAGYPAHLKNKGTVRLWGGQEEMGNLKRVGELESKATGFRGRQRNCGEILKRSDADRCPREPKRKREGRESETAQL